MFKSPFQINYKFKYPTSDIKYPEMDIGYWILDIRKWNSRGFTLIETVVALAILSAAVVGPMSLVSRGITDIRASKNRLIASYLAEEGLEIVRAVKENNALSGLTKGTPPCGMTPPFSVPFDKWQAGICPGTWQADSFDFELAPDAGTPLRFDYDSVSKTGLYRYGGSGPETIFKRTIAINQPIGAEVDNHNDSPGPDTPSGLTISSNNMLDVAVTVSWRDGFFSRSIQLTERFYNWQ